MFLGTVWLLLRKKTTLSQRFSIAIPFSGDYYWKQAGYEELAGRFGQIRNV